MATLALGATAPVQIDKLPIGSLDELVNYTASHTDLIQLQVVAIANTANGVTVRPVANKDYPYNLSDGKLESFVRQKIRESLETAINLKDVSLASVKFGVSCLGLNHQTTAAGEIETVLFFAGNNFSLEKNATGALVIPITAYEVNVAGSIAEQDLTLFFVSGVKRVQVEVFDGEGRVIESQDSQKHQPGDLTVSLAPDNRGFFLPLKEFMGKSGRITITYQNSSEQTFNLQDGKPFQAALTEFRRLTESSVTSAGVQFYVTGNVGDIVAIETTANLEGSWIRADEISSFLANPEKKRIVYPTSPLGRGFFRARVVSKKQP